MATAVAPDKDARMGSLAPDAIAHLARTFGHHHQPVWIHDLSGRCVYRNPAALRARPRAEEDWVETILDDQDRPVGRLCVGRESRLP